MKKLNNPEKLRDYVVEHNLQEYMDNDLLAISSLYMFEKDEHLIRTGTMSEYLYFLVEGRLMVYSYTSDTKNICINYLYHSTLIGEAASLWENVPTSSVKALTPCICVCVKLSSYRQRLQNDVRFLKNICQILSYRLNSEAVLANSLTEPVEARLANFILQHTKDDVFSFQLTTCAAILNVSYRHLLRTLMSFRELKILEKGKNNYVVSDWHQLEKLAQNLPNQMIE